MKRIYRRDFEPQIENGINVIVCVIDNDEICKNCIKELDEYSKTIPDNLNVKFSMYDVMMDVDINEKYEVSYPPYVIIFSDNKLINKFIYTTFDDFIQKFDLKLLTKINKKGQKTNEKDNSIC